MELPLLTTFAAARLTRCFQLSLIGLLPSFGAYPDRLEAVEFERCKSSAISTGFRGSSPSVPNESDPLPHPVSPLPQERTTPVTLLARWRRGPDAPSAPFITATNGAGSSTYASLFPTLTSEVESASDRGAAREWLTGGKR
jgi:hypothetical protein